MIWIAGIQPSPFHLLSPPHNILHRRSHRTTFSGHRFSLDLYNWKKILNWNNIGFDDITCYPIQFCPSIFRYAFYFRKKSVLCNVGFRFKKSFPISFRKRKNVTTGVTMDIVPKVHLGYKNTKILLKLSRRNGLLWRFSVNRISKGIKYWYGSGQNKNYNFARLRFLFHSWIFKGTNN